MTLTADTGSQSIDLDVVGIAATTYNWVVDFYIQYVQEQLK